MSERDGRYRMSQGGGGNDPDRTQVDRSWTEDFGEYKVGQPYSMDDEGFGPVERSQATRANPRVMDPAEHTRTEARYEETGYVSSGGQAYARDPRFDGQAVAPRRRPVAREEFYEEEDEARGFSGFTLALCSIAALTIGVVGTILAGGLGNKGDTSAIASIDPNAATPQQVTELNNQVAQLTATIQERDQQIHNIQTELDKVRKESAANNAAATTASQQAAQAEQRKAELDARESILNQQANDLKKLADDLKKREDDLKAGGGGSNPIEDAASGIADSAAGAASEGLDNLINQIRQGLGGQ